MYVVRQIKPEHQREIRVRSKVFAFLLDYLEYANSCGANEADKVGKMLERFISEGGLPIRLYTPIIRLAKPFL
jgi:hypothetical protein